MILGYNSGNMSSNFLILAIIGFILLVIVAAIRPSHSKLNMYELERRSELGDKNAAKALARELMLKDVTSLQYVVNSILQVVVFSMSELTFGGFAGFVVALFVAPVHAAVAHLKPVRQFSNKIYARIEKPVFTFIKKTPILFKIIRTSPVSELPHSVRIDSREELQHIVAESDGILDPEEKLLIVNSLSFNDRVIRTIMTPREEIVSVKKTEFLGPLALDELHKTGYSRLPVISSDIDHVIGILHLDRLLTLEKKRSTTAEKAMEAKVFYIHEKQTLQHALTAFMTTRHYQFIVVNEARETVGLLTLDDVIEALLGRKVEDEFDMHDSLSHVAARKVGLKNMEKSSDV